MTQPNSYIFTMHCPDRLGVVAVVSDVFYKHSAFITEVSNYSDPVSQRFFLRFVFDDRDLACEISEFEQHIKSLAHSWLIEYRLRRVSSPMRVLIAVSKFDHCLNALLNKWRSGVLPIDVVGVVSNHETCRDLAEWYKVPYHHLPVSPETKLEQEQQILEIMQTEKVDLLVLARYMQILSDDMCGQLQNHAINIHHSFLPSFKGARPYDRAYARGVKVIGATAHYVTKDLDEGPIIVQEVKPIDHEVSIDQMIHMGHDIESSALCEAVRLHTTQRVVQNGQRTVVL
ncbi:MAG: formyltetrahydrofolate deformylase [Gammaproteobacteria bacterium]|nr:formyltetrahydrofolate deformylase [Gammaproteobacteria bacterium]NNC98091.1 formyltetrahydrofolate deformylase [Gammaproteobacteria bacterium]NNM13155.1 formyltetrahydrofolate deformylase [Gammaproteobacteria bacterium]